MQYYIWLPMNNNMKGETFLDFEQLALQPIVTNLSHFYFVFFSPIIRLA